MKHAICAVAIALAFGLFASAAHAQVLYPNRGGTGTSTTPSLGQVLVGQSNGTYGPQSTSTLGFPVGTVTSIGLTAPTGLTVTGSPITGSGTLALSLTSGYLIPLTASTTEWAKAFASTTALSATSPLSYNGQTGAFSIIANGIGDTQLAFDTGQNLTTASSPTFAGLLANGFIDTSGTVGGYKIDGNLILQASSTRSSIFGGQLAGNSSYTGTLNTGFGYNALHAITSGTELVAIGANALANATSTAYDVAVGSNAMLNFTTPNVGTQSNIAIGRNAMVGVLGQSFGVRNVAIGERAGNALTTGSRNMLLGYVAGGAMTTAADNLGIGYLALTGMTTGDSNVALGTSAMQLATSTRGNTFIGSSAGSAFVGAQNSATEYNTFVGERAGQGASGFSGAQNTGVGQQVCSRLTTGAGNSCFGYRAGLNVSTGLSNVIVGQSAAATLTTGNYNTVIGMGFNGASVDVPSSSQSNFLNISNLIYGNLLSGGGNVGIGTTTPARALSVAGDALVSGTLYLADTSSSYIRWTAATSKLEMFGGSTGFEINNAVGNVKVYRHGTSASNLFNVTSTGLVGASGIQSAMTVDPTMAQTGTAGYNGLLVNITESTTGSGRKMLFSAQTAGVDKFNITSAGNVGIGTTSPSSLFQVFSTGTSTASFDSNSASKGSCLEFKDRSGVGYSYATFEDGVMTVSATSCK